MRLTRKAAMLVAAAMLISQIVVFSAASALILADHHAREEAAARQDIELVGQTIELDMQRLQGVAVEMRSIAQALAGSSSLNANATDQLTISILSNNDIDFLVMQGQDQNGTPMSIGIELGDDGVTYIPVARLPADFDGRATPHHGIVWEQAGPMMMALQPLPFGNQSFTITAGRSLDAVYLASVAERTGLDVAVLHPDAADHFRIERTGVDALSGYAPLVLSGGSEIVVRVDGDRSIVQQAWETIAWFAGGSIVVIGAVTLVTVWLLQRWVTGPIRRLHADVAKQDPDVRLLEANDEVHALERGFATLMQQLAQEQERLEESNRDLASFASVVSHDLKSPLSTLRLTISSLKRSPDLAADMPQKQLLRMDRSIRGMHARIDGILAYSRAGEHDQDMRPTSLDAIMRRVRDDLQAAVGEEGASLDIRRMPTVMADPEPLAQMLQNLVGNGIKYGREGVPINVVVWATRDGDDAIIHVRDNGRGFNEEEARHMMDPFVRLASASGTEGHGIGLATCRRIAERHGTQLMAAGRPGEGAEFSFRLPLAGAQRPPRPGRQFEPVQATSQVGAKA